MTTTEVATIEEAEVIEVDTMSKKEATALNRKIKSASDKVANNAFELLSLLEQAATGNIHKALGYKSWTEWYSENVQIDVSDKGERKMLATMMSGKGMSQRAIAASLGVGQATVSRDLEGEGDSDESGEVTGLDGKTYSKGKGKGGNENDPEIIEGEVVEEAETERRLPLPAQIKAAVAALAEVVEALSELSEDDRFAKSRKTIRKNHEESLVTSFNALAEVFDKLEIELEEEDTEEEDTEEEDAEDTEDTEDTEEESDEFEEDEDDEGF